MEHLNDLSMELLRTNKADGMTSAHSSAANMSKSISGASLSSSQATHRTQCSSGLSSVSARFGNLSSSPTSPTGDGEDDATGGGGRDAPKDSATASSLPAPRLAAPVAGGGKTVLAGVAPSCYGKLRRRARFHGWREAAFFELRSTALLTFSSGSGTTSSSGGGSGSGNSSSSGYSGHHHHGGGLASLAAKIIHPRHAQVGVDWSWSMDLCGAERVVELPASSRKDVFAFQVEFPAREKRKTLVLAAPSAAERERWMVAMDRAKRRVHPEVSSSNLFLLTTKRTFVHV